MWREYLSYQVEFDHLEFSVAERQVSVSDRFLPRSLEAELTLCCSVPFQDLRQALPKDSAKIQEVRRNAFLPSEYSS
jgi:hypothetical protein